MKMIWLSMCLAFALPGLSSCDLVTNQDLQDIRDRADRIDDLFLDAEEKLYGNNGICEQVSSGTFPNVCG